MSFLDIADFYLSSLARHIELSREGALSNERWAHTFDYLSREIIPFYRRQMVLDPGEVDFKKILDAEIRAYPQKWKSLDSSLQSGIESFTSFLDNNQDLFGDSPD